MAYWNGSPDLLQYLLPDRETKSILWFLSETTHKDDLEMRLLSCGFMLNNISKDKIEAMKVDNSVSDEDFEACINEFLSQFSSWNKKLENCSEADGFHIVSLLKSYNSKCRGSWYENTSIILITGPKLVVEEIKKLLQEHFKGRSDFDVESVHLIGGKAVPFVFAEISPAIMRFVMRQRKFNEELKIAMSSIGYVEIKNKNKLLTVEVIPNKNSEEWPHEDFRSLSTNVLKGFFGNFETWNEVFDPNLLATGRTQDLFQTKSTPTLHVKWHPDTHTMIVTGERSYVEDYKCKVQHALRRVESARPVNRSTYPNSPSYEKSSVRPKTAAPFFQRSKKNADPVSTSRSTGTSILMDETKDIPPGVLKFVLNDNESRTELSKCCEEYAKAYIKNDEGKINIYIKFNDQTYTYEDERLVFSAVKDYFSKFITKKVEWEKTKLQQVAEQSRNLFDSKTGFVHIRLFPDSGTVIITGLADKVEEKEREIINELSAEIEEEVLQADIFIAQRECNVWVRAQELCNSSGLNVSIASPDAGKVQYKGEPSAIIEGKTIVNMLTNSLHDQQVQGLSSFQNEFLQKFVLSQQDFVKNKKNNLDALYKLFKDYGTKGALRIFNSEIHLICVDQRDWETANAVLAGLIIHFAVDLNRGKCDSSPGNIYKSLANKLEETMVLLKPHETKKAAVYCLSSEMTAIKQRVKGILHEISDTAPTKIFCGLESKNLATHIYDFCTSKIYDANSVKVTQQSGRWGLSISCETECFDFVKTSLEDLTAEIIREEKAISGSAVHDWLEKYQQHIVIGKETNCSIFLKPQKQTETSNLLFRVKIGDILNESCDAIVNSTGGSEFSGNQVSVALGKKYGSETLKTITSGGPKWSILHQAFCYPTYTLLPWTHIINISTPSNEKDLKKFLKHLLQEADKHGIKSLAMPTIGTGNMGMDHATVATCMKEAFHSFKASPFRNLKAVQVVIYEKSLYSTYKDVAPMKDASTSEQRSADGITVEIYGNNHDNVRRALKKLEKKIEDNQRIAVIEDASICGFTDYVASQAAEICQKHGVEWTWSYNRIGTQQFHLFGVTEYVNEAEADIKKLLDTDYPSSWSKMTPGRGGVEKILLNIGSPEFNKVEAKFKESSPSYSRIIKIERIQIPSSYKLFKTMKDNKITELKTSAITRNLFHGTTVDKVDKILSDKFDRNFAGVNGTVYGRGVYFAVNSSYSVGYAKDHQEKCMFLAEVITGDYMQGNSQYKAPPPKPNGKLYDSLVDNMQSPTIFVVFHDDSVYPHYLITFQ